MMEPALERRETAVQEAIRKQKTDMDKKMLGDSWVDLDDLGL